jgi:class 3 adenylate cyclase
MAPVFQGSAVVGVCGGACAAHWASADPATTVTPTDHIATKVVNNGVADQSPRRYVASRPEWCPSTFTNRALDQVMMDVALHQVPQVLALDEDNIDAEDLLTAPNNPGEIRRLTFFFADLVDSTVLSTRVEPETYRVAATASRCDGSLQRYEGHISSTKGDGLLAVFGHPIAYDNDARRAVQAGLEITREVARLSEQACAASGSEIAVRVGVHRGLYLDTAQDDVYGLAANLAARVSALAPPGSVVVSDVVEPLVRNHFEVEVRPPAPVKGVDGLISHYRVVSERVAPAAKAMHGPLVGRDQELARLEENWARAKAGRLTMPAVVFRAASGMGWVGAGLRPRRWSWWSGTTVWCWSWPARHFTRTSA